MAYIFIGQSWREKDDPVIGPRAVPGDVEGPLLVGVQTRLDVTAYSPHKGCGRLSFNE